MSYFKGVKLGLKHRAKKAYLETEVAKIIKDQAKISQFFEKHEKKAARERAKYTKTARRMIRGIDEDGTIHITFRDRNPNDSHPIIELWDEDDNYIILICTLVKRGRFRLTELHALFECEECTMQHRMVGREIIGLRDVYLAMNDAQPECKMKR